MILKRSFFSKKSSPYRIHVEETNAAVHFSNELLKVIERNKHREKVIVCIGTDRSTGDALGPLVGSYLQSHTQSTFHVYGTLEKPVHAVNLQDCLTNLQTEHEHPFIIAIDACLGGLNSVGKISLAEGPVKPGAAVNKKLPEVGDIHITGIVNIAGMMEYFVLQNTRLHFVMKIAETIAESLLLVDKGLKKQELQQSTFFKPLKPHFFKTR